MVWLRTLVCVFQQTRVHSFWDGFMGSLGYMMPSAVVATAQEFSSGYCSSHTPTCADGEPQLVTPHSPFDVVESFKCQLFWRPLNLHSPKYACGCQYIYLLPIGSSSYLECWPVESAS